MKNYFLTVSLFFVSLSNAQTGVGIGTTNPQKDLHIKGSLRLDNPSKGNGYLLQVFDQGSMKWSPLIPNAVTGTIGSLNGYSGDVPNDSYMNGKVTLAPGKWLVKISLLIPTDNTANATSNPDSSLIYNDIIIKVATYFSDSQTVSTKTNDYIAGSASSITGFLVTPSMYGLVEGYALLNNSTNASKTYYLWGKSERRAVTSDPYILPLYKLSAFWGENLIYAYPISN